MSEGFREYVPNIKGLERCPECNDKIVQDIFQLPKGEKRNGGRLLEGRACFKCNIIYEVVSDDE